MPAIESWQFWAGFEIGFLLCLVLMLPWRRDRQAENDYDDAPHARAFDYEEHDGRSG